MNADARRGKSELSHFMNPFLLNLLRLVLLTTLPVTSVADWPMLGRDQTRNRSARFLDNPVRPSPPVEGHKETAAMIQNWLNSLVALTAAATLVACSDAGRDAAPSPGETAGEFPSWSFAEEMIFPADRSLRRPEDGVVLPDGRLIVADQVDGLRLVRADGSSRPFGRLADAGYLHDPPEIVGAPNGVTLEPSGTHILVADAYRGGIYRIDIATETTERIYQHRYGVNMARGDRHGGI
jgi:sugar lactone lactonase YvrE